MLVVLSPSSTTFKAFSKALNLTIFRELDYELLHHINIAIPLPYVVALKTNTTLNTNAYNTEEVAQRYMLIHIPHANNKHSLEELAMLCGILYTLPLQVQCVLYLDTMLQSMFHSQRKQLKEQTQVQNAIQYFFSHSIYYDNKTPPLYTDIQLNGIQTYGVIHQLLYALCTLVQKHWGSHCIQSLHILHEVSSNMDTSTPQDIDIKDLELIIPTLLECLEALQSIKTIFRIPNIVHTQLCAIKQHYGFSKTQMIKIYTLLHGHLQSKNMDVQNILTILNSAVSIKKNNQQKNNDDTPSLTQKSNMRNNMFTQLCNKLLEK